MLFPRFVDVRWLPSSGKYPMEYVVQYEYGYDAEGRKEPDYRLERTLVSGGPYAAFSFNGAGPGRLRVKARNALGESEWTKWRCFRFDR